ncbi:hypothetical protein, conserved [Eimeria brunetti]|uniref:Uncharacterized protein n=1 Tax=Eimeria brunetti TaxID=51314 RepID=U6LK43_9EIME|nr:hypothetical protein, conserved [Eimeria brunetti]
MTQQGGPSQAAVPEPCLLRLSTQAKEAPYNEAATVAVQFSVTAEKAALGSLHAFCTFLGKVHETGPFSSWPSEEGEGESPAVPCSSIPCEGFTKEGNVNSTKECSQLAAVNFELNLTPFSFPATFCEQFIRETFTFTVVKTPESTSEGPQRKEAQTKAAAKADGREKGAKKAGPPRSIIPPGESRIAEMPVAALLLLKDGECMQPPEGVQEALATIPGVVSLRIEVKAVTSLLSPALRHLLNPVWFLIRDVRHLPSPSHYPQKRRAGDALEGTTEVPAAAPAPTTPAGAGAGAGTAVVPVASSPAPIPETKGTPPESQLRGEPSSEPSCPTEGPLEYFARAHLLRKVLETEPRRATGVLGAKRVAWDAGFLCFWGPSVEDQNELKDFIEERRLEVELLNMQDLTGVDQSNLYPEGPAGQFKTPLGSKVAAEAKELEQKEEEQYRYPLENNHNSQADIKNAAAVSEAGADILTGFLISDGRQAQIPSSQLYRVNSCMCRHNSRKNFSMYAKLSTLVEAPNSAPTHERLDRE